MIDSAGVIPGWRWLLVSVSSLALAACQPRLVPVPQPGADHAPVITVSASPSGGTGTVQLPSASQQTCPSPCKNAVTLTKPNPTESDDADIVLTIQAQNPGGVKDLSVIVSQNGPLYSASTSSTPNAQGLVPDTLQIWGTNNAGGVGSNPLLIHLNKFVHSKTSATVVAEAGNYNGERSLYAVTYYSKDHVQASLSVARDHIYDDEKSKLTWTSKNADHVAIDPPLPGHPLPLELNGSAEVGPFAKGTHSYTLTAGDWLETAPPQQRTITVAERPQLGGSITTTVVFTCTNSPNGATAYIAVAGQCVSSCTKPDASSLLSFSKSSTATVPCSGNSGSTTIFSPSNLASGTWRVTVTPNVPYMNLTAAEAFSCSGVTLKAGEHPTVTVRYTRNSDMSWNKQCSTYP
jgi:hypothetical protein